MTRASWSRMWLAAVLAGTASVAACATPGVALPYLPSPVAPTPREDPDAGIGALAPYTILSVPLKSATPVSPLPPPASFCAEWTGPPISVDWADMSGQAREPDCQAAGLAEGEGSHVYGLTLARDELDAMRPRRAQGVSLPQRRWFSTVQPRPALSFSDRHWLYQPTDAPALGVGNLNANAPAWGSSAPIGGLQIYDRFDSNSNLEAGQVGFSSSIGRLNLMDPQATEGEVNYGAAAGSSTVRFGLTQRLTLEGQMQSAPGLSTRGIGTRYDAGNIGTFEAGVTQSRLADAQAWRYRFGYQVTMAESLTLGVRGEGVGAGFGDLGSYHGGVNSEQQMRSTLSAGLPLHGLGTLSGTYSSSALGSSEVTDRRVGLEHSIELESKARLAVGADRDLLTGEHGWRARLSVPVDVFMRGHWLRF